MCQLHGLLPCPSKLMLGPDLSSPNSSHSFDGCFVIEVCWKLCGQIAKFCDRVVYFDTSP